MGVALTTDHSYSREGLDYIKMLSAPPPPPPLPYPPPVVDEDGNEEGDVMNADISDQSEAELPDVASVDVGASHGSGQTHGSMNNIIDGGAVPASKKKGLFGMMGL